MQQLLSEFEHFVQTQQYVKADKLVENLLVSNELTEMQRKDALKFLYRIGYVYPQRTLEICRQRKDIPRPFIDILNIELGNIPPYRNYKKADTLVAIKIALMRKNYIFAKYLTYRLYKSYNLKHISLVHKKKLNIGNNDVRLNSVNNLEKVSIIVTSYNSAKFIKNCVDSLLNQTLSNIEIIVVDDASTDDTIKILRSYNDLIKVVSLKSNKGTYFARNMGIEAATGSYITFQDSDDWSHPQRIQIQLKKLVNNNNIVANYSYFFRINLQTNLPDCRQRYPLLRLNLSSLMIKKQNLLSFGGFDDTQRVESDLKLFNQIIVKFKKSSIEFIKLPLSIGALRKDSLTNSTSSGFNRYGYSEKRNIITYNYE